MRKTQVALASLALFASAATLADGVTVYGSLDAGFINSDAGTAMSGAGEYNATWWGLKGSEDLGGGLKAAFHLEQGLSLGNGGQMNGGNNTTQTANGNGMFNRAANVSLASDMWGTVKIGTQLSPYVATTLGGMARVCGAGCYVPALAISHNSFAPFDQTGGEAGGSGGFFVTDAVSYTTPSFSGLTATYATKIGTNAVRNEWTSGSINYANGALNVGIATTAADNNKNGGGFDYRNTSVAGSYDFGAFQVNAARTDHSVASNLLGSNTGYVLGISASPITNVDVGLNYARGGKISGVPNSQAPAITSLTAKYNLSKATSVYVSGNWYNQAAEDGGLVLTNGSGWGNNRVTGNTVYTFGMQTMF